MAERRRLAEDRVGAPRWGRWFVYAVLVVAWTLTVAQAAFCRTWRTG